MIIRWESLYIKCDEKSIIARTEISTDKPFDEFVDKKMSYNEFIDYKYNGDKHD